MIFHRIHIRLILAFILFVATLLIASGWMLHWVMRQSLEAELGRKLMAVARAATVQFDFDDVTFLVQNTGPRTRHRLRQRLEQLRDVTGVERIYIFDANNRSLIDTDTTIVVGAQLHSLRFRPREMNAIREGQAVHTVLFESIEGEPTMSAYAPLTSDAEFQAGIGVDGSVTFLDAVSKLQNRLYWIGVGGLLVSILLGLALAVSIRRPLQKLIDASDRIGKGEYDEPIPKLGESEIGHLAVTMEDMRLGILERERELKAMLAGVAHEIRNPLGGIELFAGLLSDELKSGSEAETHINRISREVSQLKEIIDHFLIYARPRDPNPEPCDLRDVLDEVHQLLIQEIKDQKIRINQSIPSRIKIFVDPMHLKRIFLNLFRNAIQAMPMGGELTIHVEDEAGIVRCTISDEGTGIAKEIQDRIFTPFFTTRQQGTGLGLSIVRGLIEANGGTIRLTASDDRGTHFELRFVTQSESNEMER